LLVGVPRVAKLVDIDVGFDVNGGVVEKLYLYSYSWMEIQEHQFSTADQNSIKKKTIRQPII
jgi:hypothetical protein